MKFIHSILIIISLSGCNLEVNTTNPQLSSSLFESINKGVFVCAFKASQLSTSKLDFIVEEAWVERVWKYSINSNNQRDVEIFDQRMLVIKGKNKDHELSSEKYLFTWFLEDEKDNSFQTQNGVYGVQLKDGKIPGQIKVYIKQMQKMDFKHTTTLSEIKLIKGCK